MGIEVDHIQGKTFHRRKGQVGNAFTYGIDYMLLDLSKELATPWAFSRNRFNLTGVYDIDHGGARGSGRGAHWARSVLTENGLTDLEHCEILLMAQPRLLGHVFNPVSFWMVIDPSGLLRAVIAEVNNTFGERHSYLCHHPDLRPIQKADELRARKVFHVSPFQKVSGNYSFRFHYSDTKIGVWITYENNDEGVYATFTGNRRVATSASIFTSAIKRPFGSIRVLALIHWQALKLKIRGAKFRSKPGLPKEEVSSCVQP